MELCWRQWPCVVLCYLIWLTCAICANQPLHAFGSLSPSHLFPEPHTVAHLNYAFPTWNTSNERCLLVAAANFSEEEEERVKVQAK